MTPLVLAVIDGLRSDAVDIARTPCIDRLMAEGAFSMTAQTVEPSITLPVHFSLFTSLAPISHGVITNTAVPDISSLSQNIYTHVRTFGGTTAAFYSWEHLRNLSLPGTLDHIVCQKVNSPEKLNRLAGDAAGHIVAARPDFTFIYLEWPDIAGHANGWMSEEYIRAVEEADQALGMIAEPVLSAGDPLSMIVLSDHGGQGSHHTENTPEIRTIPFVACGPGIRKSFSIPGPVSILDAAPTIAALMGIPPHTGWEGSCLDAILT